VREDGGDGEASGALDVHEEGARAGDKHLQLVLAGLGLRGGVEEIDCENLQGTQSVNLFAIALYIRSSEMRRWR